MAGSPAKHTTSHSKRFSMTVMPSAKSAEVMTNLKQSCQTNLDSDSNSGSARTALDSTATRDQGSSNHHPKSNSDSKRPSRRASRDSKVINPPAIDTPKPTPKLVKRPPLSSPLGHTVKDSLDKSYDKSAQSRSSFTLRGLTSTLHLKDSAPSSLPKYKGKASPRGHEESKRRKKPSDDWETDKEGVLKGGGEKSATEEDEEDGGFVQVERPVSPLPRRAARKPLLPVALTSSSPTSFQKSVLHKPSKSLDSSHPKIVRKSPSPTSTPRPITNPLVSRPASTSSHRNTPVCSSKKSLGLLHTPLIRNTRRRVSPPEVSQLESSPSNPFLIHELNTASLLSPPLSPFLESASLDSLDANDVSALLTTIISPIKPNVDDDGSKVHPITEKVNNVFLPPSGVPHTPFSYRPISMISTDPRQSILSIQQLLEKSGDIDHLLSQPLPSTFTPDVRERLLSFGFSPDGAQIFNHFSEPQTPSPPSENRMNYSSISQILFPTSEEPTLSIPAGSNVLGVSEDTVRDLEAQLSTAQSKQEARVEQLEQRLLNLRETREREASELGSQVKVLEERIQQLLADKEQESEERRYQFEQQLKDKDNQCQDKVLAAITQISNTQISMRNKEVALERRRSSLFQTVAAWTHLDDVARSELALFNANRRSIQIIISGLDTFMSSLRLHVGNEPTL